jgi:membrane associated rhomboid family serine protease
MALYVGFDVWLASMGDGDIAWIAHGAGFALGVLVALLVREKDD